MASTSGIKLDDETKARLQALAALRDRSPHWIIKKAVKEYLEREERYEQEKQEDEERWQRYLLTGEAYTQEEMEAWAASLLQEATRTNPRA